MCAACSRDSGPSSVPTSLPHSAVSVSEKPSDFCRRNSLLIMHWNAEHIRTKIVELSAYLVREGVDICLIQESKLTTSARTPKVEGYVCLRKDRPPIYGGSGRGAGDLLIFVKDDIPFQESSLVFDKSRTSLESMGISIKTGARKKFSIFNLYCPPVRSTVGETRSVGFEPSIFHCTKDTLICGDLNCHSPMWDDNQPSDRMEERLEN